MKICSLYGVGFYYVPGTDMCLKIGGWVRAEYAYGDNGNFAWGWANGNVNNRTTNNSTWRARGYITADARSQTEYGTVRGYLAVGLSTNNTGFDGAANTFSANRAFIQWAGFTFGLSQSFFDFYSSPSTSYWGSFPASDTGDGGWMVAGYTAQFGNGFSGTIAAEMRRTTQIVNSGTTVLPGAAGNEYGGFQAPDLVANLRVDQAWGSAQIMGALHQVNARYYGGATAVQSGHPDDDLGFAVGAGIRLNAPMIGQGDYLQAQINYTQGALRYAFQTPNSNYGKVEGADLGFGVLSDAVYGGTVVAGNATQLNLTTAWNINAAYEHFWNPQWRTSLYGGYGAVSYNEQANNMLCSFAGAAPVPERVRRRSPRQAATWIGAPGGLARAPSGMSPRTSTWASMCCTRSCKAPTHRTMSCRAMLTIGNATTVSDVDNWQFRFRVHRDFYP